jgi:error-prone DNA polymerase
VQPSYAELYCLSNFSFLRAASHPEELVKRAAVLGYSALAITDECSVSGIVRAHLEAKSCGLKLIVGSEFQLGERPNAGPKIVLLATSRKSYGALSALITLARRRSSKGGYQLTLADLMTNPPDCLALLIANASTSVSDVKPLQQAFPKALWIAVSLHKGADDAALLAHLEKLSENTGVPCVATGHVLMHEKKRKRLHDVLAAVRHKMPVAELGTAIRPNAEQAMRPMGEIAKIYPAAMFAETLVIAARCHFSLDELRHEYPEEIVPPGETPASYLRRLTYDGLVARYTRPTINSRMQGDKRRSADQQIDIAASDGKNVLVPKKIVTIIEHELKLIAEMRYEPFFLTVYDVVKFARSRHILCQGRGSAANSAVCFCLGITEIDPGRLDVLFERFVSKERGEPPDIDVDFEHERREEVIQYIYKKYGRHRTALAATLITYRTKSALRDVGKALGMSLDQIDRLSSTLAWWDRGKELGERVREAGLDPESPLIQRVIELSQMLIGFPRHLSQHVGGFVIARDELSLLVPIENAAMPERTVIQWDKDDLKALGLLKVDVLALGMLTAIRRTLDILNSFHDTDLSMQDIPAEDSAVYDMICAADTVGVFQIESRAQMSMLPRLKPRCYYDLVIEVAIVRPGPIQGGMVHPYLRRREGVEPVTYPSEAVKSVLERTLGVSIFQEQVMQLAVVAANFTPGEADQLRRSMAAWKRKGGLAHFHEKLVKGMLANGLTTEYAEQIFKQIQGFGEYGFPESHAASFALLAYVSSWLKCHHPAAFACGLINSQPMGFYSPSQIVQDAQRHGVEVRAIDVAQSDWECALERAANNQPALRLGLKLVNGLSQEAAMRIAMERAAAPFTDLQNLAKRCALNSRDLNALAAADALAQLSGQRRHAYWQALGIHDGTPLIHEIPREQTAPSLEASTEVEEVRQDYATTGLTLRRHPMVLLRDSLKKQRLIKAADLVETKDGQYIRTAGIVTCRQRPGTASGVIFVTLEDETGNTNVVVWSSVVEKQRRILLRAHLMMVHGKIERQAGVIHLIAHRLTDISHMLDDLQIRSHDFH